MGEKERCYTFMSSEDDTGAHFIMRLRRLLRAFCHEIATFTLILFCSCARDGENQVTTTHIWFDCGSKTSPNIEDCLHSVGIEGGVAYVIVSEPPYQQCEIIPIEKAKLEIKLTHYSSIEAAYNELQLCRYEYDGSSLDATHFALYFLDSEGAGCLIGYCNIAPYVFDREKKAFQMQEFEASCPALFDMAQTVYSVYQDEMSKKGK